tara:strand:- start:442 stop:732 length:291 start_codon:yes stop_codon:yes gene_type:complete
MDKLEYMNYVAGEFFGEQEDPYYTDPNEAPDRYMIVCWSSAFTEIEFGDIAEVKDKIYWSLLSRADYKGYTVNVYDLEKQKEYEYTKLMVEAIVEV